ncbi:cobyrinate a,c-diamide synthase [Massilia yuzhufengensis]|uniref:Hydrogenobyrinic acid a,c-diamide synthase (Glutamine-hydrolysing) /cobyrinate a,c-diamide synthase n=1 Tax=Massilia yuzhufengensis TaxID=1164594 RepID=A0A1I1WTA2_9BURK|nr:cobyrinate a,c-diamide synthase [Massilia yuzhufengensis]SFD97608.1 hydrogenobyrinic acid a,c-diamide synthase (glutamine-hydrolysing) /cobyrinate a,c-diamide synthase [Massilia yuzhufengensis]
MDRDTGARAVLVAAMASGQGKTSVTAALARKLLRQGLRVRVFKCGPDFIDPMLLERASGAPVHTLDLWMVGIDECRRHLHDAARETDAILIEGVMGLYDGSPSAADLAREFGVPVLAVIDASAMAQTTGAVARGLRDYGPVDLAGVVANRVAGERHAGMVASSLRDIPLVGWLPRQERPLPERHLGLVLPDEVEGLEALLDKLADELHFNDKAWKALPVLAQSAPEWQDVEPVLEGRTVAIARDAAFCFLYPANLDLLEKMGASLRYFSPLADEPVPGDADAVFLPGGYPELHCEALAQAAHWQASIRDAHARSTPILAECGGMMAVAEGLTDKDGKRWPMAGLLPGEVRMQPRLGGLGAQAMPTAQGPLRGHTFHYSHFDTPAPAQAHAVKTSTGSEGEAQYRVGSLTASYFHAYFPSNPPAVAALLGGAAP